jgi:hypothetical protein
MCLWVSYNKKYNLFFHSQSHCRKESDPELDLDPEVRGTEYESCGSAPFSTDLKHCFITTLSGLMLFPPLPRTVSPGWYRRCKKSACRKTSLVSSSESRPRLSMSSPYRILVVRWAVARPASPCTSRVTLAASRS